MSSKYPGNHRNEFEKRCSRLYRMTAKTSIGLEMFVKGETMGSQ